MTAHAHQPQPTKGEPYVIEVGASVSARLLTFQPVDNDESYFAEQERLNSLALERMPDLVAELGKKSGLPDNAYITYSVTIRPAAGYEAAGENALYAELLTFDVCPGCEDDLQMEVEDEEGFAA